MSEESIGVVLESFRRIRPGHVKDSAALWHPDGRATPTPGWPEPGPFVGRDAIVRQLERLFADLSEHHFDDIEVVADSGSWVVVSWRWRIRGAASEIETTLDQATAFRVEDGLIMEAHFRTTVPEALEAAGLSE